MLLHHEKERATHFLFNFLATIDPSPLSFEIANSKETSTIPAVLSEAAVSASILDNPSRQLQQFCESMFGDKPAYLVAEDGPPQGRGIVPTIVLHSEDNIVGAGHGKQKI